MTGSKRIYLFIAANLAFLIPVPGRLAYAVILLVLFNIQMAAATLLFHAIHRLSIGSMQNAILSLTIVALGIFYKQVLTIVCPVAALTLGFCIFLPTLASVIIEFFFLDYEHGLRKHLAGNMRSISFITVFGLLFFLARDILGYGTVTLPGWRRLVVLHLPYNPESGGASVFLATVPGSMVLVALILMVYILIVERFRILSAVSETDGSAGEAGR